MFQIIRQFTFHRPKEIIQPTVWLFLSQACSMLPAILAYMAIYTLGQAFVPPYTLDLQLLITLTAIGLGYILLQYAVELVSYYFTYGVPTVIRRKNGWHISKSCAASRWDSFLPKNRGS